MIKLVNSKGVVKNLPLTLSFRRVPLDFDIPNQPLFGRDGAVKTGKHTIRERQFTLEGGLYQNTRQELDNLLSFLMQSPIKVYRQDYHDRYLIAEPLGAQQDWANLDAEVMLRIPMVALDPYWHGDEVTETFNDTKTITVDGTTPTLPKITTTGSVSSLQVTNQTTGQSFGASGSSGVYTVDNKNFDFKVGGTSRMDMVSDTWLIRGFELVPGDNQISTSQQIKLSYSPRWL